MQWIYALDLEQWADRVDTRTTMPELVADLIRAYCDDIQAYRFPSGDKGQVRGFDGHLSSSGAPPYVPEGESIWEFGVGSPIRTKMDADYKKRTGEVPENQRTNTTLVLVTPRTWNDPNKKLDDWVSEKKQKGDWKDVRLFDGSVLERWLKECPGVAASYARRDLRLYPNLGVWSIHEFWTEYSSRFKPALTEDVLLCERDEQSADLIQKLNSGNGTIPIAADSPDEAIAFVVAAIRKANPPALRFYLEDRTLIVDTEDAAKQLIDRENLIFLPRAQAARLSGALGRTAPAVAAYGRDLPNSGIRMLERPSSFNLGKALETMNFSDEEAYQLARSCGRSVTILERLIPSGPPEAPEWLKDGGKLLPALLAGGWDSASELDTLILEKLSGDRTYANLEKDLLAFTLLQDPPIDREQSVWKIRAPVDAFVHLGRLISKNDLERLREAATTVFSFIPPPPDPNAPYVVESAKPDKYSSWLRDGIANTLLQIAVLHSQAKLLIPDQSPSDYVEDIIRDLPGLQTDHRLVSSLEQQLPLLMEAAPAPLFEALEYLLEGDGERIKPIFVESDSIFTPHSPHTYVLWALETMAWDPSHLSRVAKILAQLARIDPGGRLGNRPFNSLREILLCWHPQTNASLTQRLSAVDYVLKTEADVGWKLLLGLLPKTSDTSSNSSRPRFREAGASERKTLTNGEVWEGYKEISHRVLANISNSKERWVDVIGAMSNFYPEERAQTYELLEKFLQDAPPEAFRRVWTALQEEVNHHLAFIDAGWALPKAELNKLEDLLRTYEPTDVVLRNTWLFDDWYPDIPEKKKGGRDAVEAARFSAVSEIKSELGIDGVIRLAEETKMSRFIAEPFTRICDDISNYEYFIRNIAGKSAELDLLCIGLSSGALDRFGQEWFDCVEALYESKFGADSLTNLLLNWPQTKTTWEFVDKLGNEIRRLYWRKISPWRIPEGDDQALLYFVERLKLAGRPIAAIDGILDKLAAIPSDIILDLLDAAIREINEAKEFRHQMFSYNLVLVLNELENREDVSDLALAQREYAFLPLLENEKRNLTIHRIMAQEPSFYVSVICDVFKAKSEEPREISAEARTKARIGYDLLRTFTNIPGLSETGVALEVLRKWVTEVVALAEEKDRKDIAETYIGQLIAHAPDDKKDGAWPTSEIRDLIEEIESDAFTRGILIERHNMRGVYSKALFEGGKQERELAEKTREWAKKSEKWPKTSALLMALAKNWERDADWADASARQDKMRD